MLRMASVAALVGLVYALVGLWGDRPPPERDVGTFGDPWTLVEFITAIEAGDLSVVLVDAAVMEQDFERLAGLRYHGPLVLAELTLEARFVEVFVYPNADALNADWVSPSGPTEPRGVGPSDQAYFALDNLVAHWSLWTGWEPLATYLSGLAVE
jgi:hypothetical protein